MKGKGVFRGNRWMWMGSLRRNCGCDGRSFRDLLKCYDSHMKRHGKIKDIPSEWRDFVGCLEVVIWEGKMRFLK